MKRERFLREFLGALGAVDIVFSEVGETHVAGTVIYSRTDQEDKQGFCWHMTEDSAPTVQVTQLAKLLNDQKLLDIDKIVVPTSDLLDRYNRQYGTSVGDAEFATILDELESIEVAMVDEGRETDAYFIHE